MNVSLSRETPPAVDGTCPACSAGLVNVQGLTACATCGWVAPRHR